MKGALIIFKLLLFLAMISFATYVYLMAAQVQFASQVFFTSIVLVP